MSTPANKPGDLFTIWKFGKTSIFQQVDGELPVTECRQKDYIFNTYEEKILKT